MKIHPSFIDGQLMSPEIAEAEAIIRNCVHCGVCLATCPTYMVTQNELDSPRGRIWLIREMLEAESQAVSAQVVHHLDRCTSCDACVRACPADVRFDRLIDFARTRIDQQPESKARAWLVWVLTTPWALRIALVGGRMARLGWQLRPLRHGRPVGLFQNLLGERLSDLVSSLPLRFDPPSALVAGEQMHMPARRPDGQETPKIMPRGHVLLHTGCVQQQMGASITEATIELLTRMGYVVHIREQMGCCGALAHHAGSPITAKAHGKQTISQALQAIEGQGVSAIITTAAGCGTHMKNYDETENPSAEWENDGHFVARRVQDIHEFLATIPLPIVPARKKAAAEITLAYQAACSLQHGQGIINQPLELLRAAGFQVQELADKEICCGSAGIYSTKQPALAKDLRARKLATIDQIAPQAVASGNIGCITHLQRADAAPIAHTVEWLNWACGGALPAAASHVFGT